MTKQERTTPQLMAANLVALHAKKPAQLAGLVRRATGSSERVSAEKIHATVSAYGDDDTRREWANALAACLDASDAGGDWWNQVLEWIDELDVFPTDEADVGPELKAV